MPTHFEALSGLVCQSSVASFQYTSLVYMTLSTSALARHKLPEQLSRFRIKFDYYWIFAICFPLGQGEAETVYHYH
jgi:hypothetical protein